MGFLDRFKPPNLGAAGRESFVLEDWRHWFGGVLALAFAVLYPVAALLSLPFFLDHQHYFLITINAVLWLLFVLRVLLPASKIVVSRQLWVAALYFMALSFLVVLGPGYARSAWFVFCAVISALLYGTRGAIWAAVFNGIVLFAMYWFMDPANQHWAETYQLGLSNWLMFTVSLTLLSVAASLPVGFLLSRLDSALKREKGFNEQLAMERSQLSKANEALQGQMRERALAQLALRESDEKLRLMADNLPDAVIYQVKVEEGGGRRFTYVSKSVERLNEVTVRAVLDDPGTLYNQIDPEFVPALMEKEKKAIESRTTFRHTIKTILPSGKVRWFDLASTPRVTPDGQLIWDGVQVDVTEREQARQALRHSENLFRALVENSHDAICLVNMDFRFTYVNNQFCNLMGYAPEDVLGQDFRRFLAEETAPIPIEYYLARLAGEEPPSVAEFMVMRKDGAKRWVQVKASELVDSNNEVLIVGQLLDITERKEAHEALKQSENLYRALVEHSHAGIALFNAKFQFEYVNEKLCKIIGYDQEEMLGRFGTEFVAEESIQLVRDNFAARQRGEQVPDRYDIVGIRKDGQKRWLEVSASILASLEGRKQTLAQFLDITERKVAEEALKQSENLYRALVENSHAGVVLIDDNHRYEYVNDEYCNTLGYTREELLGRDFRDFLAEESLERVTNHYRMRQRGENPPARYEYKVVRKGDVKRWVEVSASVITDSRGKVHTVAQLLDITDRKVAEESLKQSEDRYRALVEHSHAGITLSDGDFRYLYVNDEFCRIMGYSREELLGQDLRQFLAEETADIPVRNYVARQRGENPPSRYQFMIVRKGGEKRWVEISSSVINDSPGATYTVAQFLDVTERRLAEEALRQSESLYRALAEHSHAGIVLLGDDFLFTYANDEFCRIMGYGLDELVGQDFRRFLAQETAHLPQQNYLARKRGENPPDRYEFMVVRKDGEKRWVETSSSIITDAQGRQQTLAQLLDVTERKAGEEALKRSEERFRASFDSAFQFTGLLTPDGRLLEANQAALDFIGMALEDVKGVLFWQAPWWSGDQSRKDRIKDAIRRAASGEFVRYEAENVGAGDSRVMVDFSLKPIRGPEGEVEMLLAVGYDITDRKKAEEALRESEEKFRQVIQASPMGVYMYELVEPDRLVFAGANPAAERILGVDTQYYLGKTIEEVFPNMADDELPRRLREIAARGANPIQSETIDYKDEWISGSFELHAFQTAPGKLTVMFQDIAERRKAEEEKARLEFQLRQSQKMEAIGTLTGGIAHDFNNILGAILGTAEASLLKGNDFGSLSANMGNIRDMTIRGRELVHRLMAFSRQDDQAVRTVNLCDVINDALVLIRATLPPNVEIRKLLPQSVWVKADVVQVQQVIMNLCTNAAQAMEDGGGVLTVRLTQRELNDDEAKLHPDIAPGSYGLIEVEDTGHGIPADTMERIFDPFFTTKPLGRGTGLGLSLVHGIVRSHGGAVSAASREGEGTVMSVLLPLASVRSEERAAAGGAAGPAEGGGERIMVVDDEEIIAHTLAQSLEALGYKVWPFTSSQEAASALKANPERFDLILTDHMMPGLTGRQLAELAFDLRPELPVALMTGMTGDHKKYLGDGHVTRVLTKPLTITEIGEAVQQILSQRSRIKEKAKA